MIKSNTMLSMKDYTNWEREVTEQLQSLIGCSNSDAQGILEAFEVDVIYCWNLNLTPLETAKLIDIKSKK